MTFRYRSIFYAVLAVASAVAMNGCKSKQQASSPEQVQGTPQPMGGQVGSQPMGGAQAGNPGAPPYNQQPGGPGAPPSQYGQPSGAPPAPAMIDLPAGTDIRVRLDEDLGSKINQPGDNFEATVADDVTVNGQVVIARGARADGTVIDAKPLGRFAGGAYLALRLERVRTNWGSYPVATSTISRAEQGKGKRTGIFAGGGGALGAIIGGVAGGGKGALIGGLLGAGAGGAGSAFTGNKEILLPAESMLTFHLDHSVHITEQPN